MFSSSYNSSFLLLLELHSVLLPDNVHWKGTKRGHCWAENVISDISAHQALRWENLCAEGEGESWRSLLPLCQRPEPGQREALGTEQNRGVGAFPTLTLRKGISGHGEPARGSRSSSAPLAFDAGGFPPRCCAPWSCWMLWVGHSCLDPAILCFCSCTVCKQTPIYSFGCSVLSFLAFLFFLSWAVLVPSPGQFHNWEFAS